MSFATSITAIWGGRGSGKTTLARKLIAEANLPRVVIIDPVAGSGVYGPRDVLEALEDKQRRVVLRATDRATILETIYATALYSHRNRPVYLVCDEAPAYLDKATEGLSKIMFQGRHRALGMMILGQRPTAVAASIRSQAEVTYWGRLGDAVDQDIAAKAIGTDRARALSTAKPGTFNRHPEKD